MNRSKPKKRHRSFQFSFEVATIWWVSFFMGFGIFPIVLDWNTPSYDIMQGLFMATFIVSFVWAVFTVMRKTRKNAEFDN